MGKPQVRGTIGEKYKKAIMASDGTYKSIAKIMGNTERAVRTYMYNHPEFREYVKERKKILVDMAEDKLCELVNEGHFKAVKFALERLDRGNYGDSVSQMIANGTGEVKIKFTTENKSKYNSVEELVEKVKND